MEELCRFALNGIVTVPNRRLTALPLESTEARLAGVEVDKSWIRFNVEGWFEVLLTVDWGSGNRFGTRFSHTAIPDHHPVHSEAIEAAVLVDLSRGKQLLRGNTVFGPKRVDRMQLEVWQNSGVPIDLQGASLEIRPLFTRRG